MGKYYRIILYNLILILILILIGFFIIRIFFWNNMPYPVKLETSNPNYELGFSEQAKTQLKDNFNETIEYFVCIGGSASKTGNKTTYFIDRLSPPNYGTAWQVEPILNCYENLGYLHSHPNDFLNQESDCKPSIGDIKSWKQENKTLYIIQCSKNKLAFYPRDLNFKEGVIYEI